MFKFCIATVAFAALSHSAALAQTPPAPTKFALLMIYGASTGAPPVNTLVVGEFGTQELCEEAAVPSMKQDKPPGRTPGWTWYNGDASKEQTVRFGFICIKNGK